MRMIKLRSRLFIAGTFFTLAVLNLPATANSDPTTGSRINALGAFSCDFQVDLSVVAEPPGAGIERDRIFSQRYAEEEVPIGTMLQKHIPLLPLSETQGFSGGRYLFSSRYQAREYEKFILEKFVYPDATQFLDRPEFSDPECRDWSVVKAWNFQPLTDHVAVRTERFDTGRTTLLQEWLLFLALRFDAGDLIAQAERQGYAEVHVLHNLRDHRVQIVYFQPRLSAINPDGLALETLANAEPLASTLAEELGLTKVFDLSHFVLTIWLPYQPADSGEAALFPNSPPLPEPFCGDGLCVPSRGEDYVSCFADCTPNCGNGLCDADETLHFCPSDCELPVVD